MIFRALIESESQRYLVLVHPGSLVGSLNFNGCANDTFSMEAYPEEVLRRKIFDEVSDFNGPTVCFLGSLDDEIEEDRDVRMAVDNCEFEVKVPFDNNHFTNGAKKIVQTVKAKKGDTFFLTGAWVGPTGCVTELARVLTSMGYKTIISPNAAKET